MRSSVAMRDFIFPMQIITERNAVFERRNVQIVIRENGMSNRRNEQSITERNGRMKQRVKKKKTLKRCAEAENGGLFHMQIKRKCAR